MEKSSSTFLKMLLKCTGEMKGDWNHSYTYLLQQITTEQTEMMIKGAKNYCDVSYYV